MRASMGWRIAERSTLSVLLLCLLLGCALTVVAILILDSAPSAVERVISGVAGALAGALVGSSASLLLARRLDSYALAEIREVLEQTSESRLTSPEGDLANLRHRWHHYHLTLVDTNPVWRHTIIPFEKSVAIGALAADVTHPDVSDGSGRIYRAEAALRGSRLLITQTALDGREAPAVEVFPAVRGPQSVHCGFAILESWDGPDILSPVMLSRNQLGGAGERSDAADSGGLLARWRQGVQAIVRDQLPSN